MRSACSPNPWPPEFPPFYPRRGLSNGHLQTIFGNFLPRANSLPHPVAQLVEVAPAHGAQIASQVLCECHWQPPTVRSSRPTVIILHGLEGSSRSQYVVGNANKVWRAGCNVIRMNMRNCGGAGDQMVRLTPTLYHSGLSGDVERAMRFFIESEGLSSVSLLGYSMGGNLVLKLAGDLGEGVPPQLQCVVGVSPVIDLAASADALHALSNRLYERRFLRGLFNRFRRKAMLFPDAFDPQRAAGIRSVREFDDRITALYSGFQSAADYYARASSARVLDRISIPTLLLHACDDPFIRLTDPTRALISANPHITLLEPEHGGHCAFLGTPDPANHNDGYWAEHTALRFILTHAQPDATSASAPASEIGTGQRA